MTVQWQWRLLVRRCRKQKMCAPVHRPAFQFSSTRPCKNCCPRQTDPYRSLAPYREHCTWLTHRYLAWAQQAKGDAEKAGHAPQARSILKDLEERSRHGYVPLYEIAVIYAGLDQKDCAFQWLARSCQDRDVEFVS